MKVLVLSDSDALCGPMAAAFLRDFSPSWKVVSAGIRAAQSIDPLAVEVMHESLIRLEGYVPRDWSEVDSSEFDVLYHCPEIEVPTTLEDYRELRDFIKNEAFLFFRKLQ